MEDLQIQQKAKKFLERIIENKPFKLNKSYKPKGDQPKAINFIVDKLNQGQKHITLLGVTGSGKTFTMANVIAKINKPTLIIAPNKTLAAQLYEEMKEFFPENAVSYFVSYYDYYQPEAYIPSTNTYIEKDASINDEIDRLRHMATSSLLSRRDVIVVASVSCLYGLGSPREYFDLAFEIKTGMVFDRDEFIRKMIDLQYERGELLERDIIVVKGDIVEFIPPYEADYYYRIEFFGDEIDKISLVDNLSHEIIEDVETLVIYPASHFATSKPVLERAIKTIREELAERLKYFEEKGKIEEAKRLKERTLFDLEMLEELGYCKGIENYSRHLTGRKPGEPPPTLLDYFPDDFLVFIDESHITIPQLRGMYKGDYSRKTSLIEYGFRLPSAYDNRPLTFEEFMSRVNQLVYVSATPGDWELSMSKDNIVEQIIRPTGLLDPVVEIRPAKTEIDDLLAQIKSIPDTERVLVTTLTKKMAEDLAEYYTKLGIKVKYMHSDIPTLDRISIINSLRRGEYKVLVGINLLREGLDIPEVSLVAILDADKEGFLRSERALIQTIGRAARNVNGRAILYADDLTPSVKAAYEETMRRRKIQQEYNKKHGIAPQTIKKQIGSTILHEKVDEVPFATSEEVKAEISRLQAKMHQYAKELNFEKAKQMRDKIAKLKILLLELG